MTAREFKSWSLLVKINRAICLIRSIEKDQLGNLYIQKRHPRQVLASKRFLISSQEKKDLLLKNMKDSKRKSNV